MFGDSKFVRIFNHSVLGCVLGIAGGFVFEMMGSLVYWIFTRYAYGDLYNNISLFTLILISIFTIGFPVSLPIGLVTGLYAAIFGHYCPKLWVWVIVAGLGSVLGFGVSGFTTNNLYGFYLNIAFLSSATGWLSYKYTIQNNLVGHEKRISKWTIICSISGLLLIFMSIFCYFNFWQSLINIPS